MSIETTVRCALDREVQKHIARHEAAARVAARDRKRYRKRTGNAPKVALSLRPDYWAVHPHFDPYYVRSRLASIAHGVANTIKTRNYTVRPRVRVELKKPGGGTRHISIFSLPDSAVSFWLTNRLGARNGHRFSSYAYAYRDDRNAHHAIQHLADAIRGRNRVFVLEYDFSKYFDSISHKYLYDVMAKYFLVDPREEALIRSFLESEIGTVEQFETMELENPGDRGIPQGTNVSLFLANVACFELDREVERVGVSFARYADDTLIVADTYEKANQAARLLIKHGDRSGTEINFDKSPGVSLLTHDRNAEFKSKAAVTFLGHKLSIDGVTLAERTVARIKARIARIIYNNLLLIPKRGETHPRRVGQGFCDWDLVNCVNEIRRYVYGKLSEANIRDALRGEGAIALTRGAVSFYPTVDEAAGAQFQALDGWLVDVLDRSYRKRVGLLRARGLTVSDLTREKLIDGTWYDFPRIPNETRIPSLFLAWRYTQRAARLYGYSRFPSPGYEYR